MSYTREELATVYDGLRAFTADHSGEALPLFLLVRVLHGWSRDTGRNVFPRNRTVVQCVQRAGYGLTRRYGRLHITGLTFVPREKP
ncbi:hypothetical protein ACFW5K_25190 [Streptomyces albidoflavus]